MFKRNTNDRTMTEYRNNIFNGTAALAIAIILALVLVSGCSGGNKLNPTDPVGSKNKQNQQGTNGTVTPSKTGDRTGVNSGGGLSGVDPSLQRILDMLVAAGGGQGGPFFTDGLIVGVYDANTLEPIEDAVVSVGNNGDATDTTDSDGFIEFIGLNVSPPPLTGEETTESPNDMYITAGADGYEMLSFNKIQNKVVAFLLNPLVAPTVESGTIHGTIDFGTDEFKGEVYVTDYVEYTDAVLEPSAPGEEEDEYSIKAEALKPCIFMFLERDPDTDKILKIYTQTVTLIPDESLQIDLEIPVNLADPMGGIDLGDPMPDGWINYVNAPDYGGKLFLPQEVSSPIATLNIFMYATSSDFGCLPVTDCVEWPVDPQIQDMSVTFATKCIPSLAGMIGFRSLQTWAVITYEDGSGCIQMIDASPGLMSYYAPTSTFVPPYMVIPPDESLGVGLTPEFVWGGDSRMGRYFSALTMTDTVNGNQWRVMVIPGTHATRLPVIPSNMDDWGLTLGNQFRVQAANDLTYYMTDGTVGPPEYLGGTKCLESKCNSRNFLYTP